MHIKRTGFLVLFGLWGLMAWPQEKKINLTLGEVIRIAQVQSPDALIAKHRFRGSYWEFKTYQAGYKPSLRLNGVLPDFSRSIDVITQSDGSEVFLERQIARTSLNMSISQNIPFTGGQIYMSSSLQRIDNISDSIETSYLTSPLNIGLRQPIFEFNQFRWDRKIEPIKYDEAKRTYIEDLEGISVKATNLFFQLLLAQINLDIQLINQANYDTLFQIARGRFNMGTIAENELLQMELNLLNSSSSVEQARLDLEMQLFELKSFLRIKDDVAIELVPPSNVSDFKIDYEYAIREARSNRSDALAFNRRLLEAESSVNQARMENRLSADLNLVFGLTQTGIDLYDAYHDPLDEQQIYLGLQIPILDWGLAKGKIRLAESNQELIKTSIEQEQIDFEQEIFLKVMQFNMQNRQLAIAAKSDTVARKRYEVTKQRYLIGTIEITELNIAQTDTDTNRKAYIAALHSYWSNYYQIRLLTLFDFHQNKRITLDINQIL
ncbi:MAG TPA: TolC family protein [Bacteroidales bacterium]|nr:TolC family protein [Bacteroidales bacterium]